MSHVNDEDETYTYEILQEKHLEESSRLLADVFSKYNPMEVFLKTTYEQLYAQALAFSKAALNDKLSIVAIHKQTKEIHGLVQAGDAKNLNEQNFEELELSKDMEVFDELERRFMKQYGELKKNDLVQIMMAGVHQDHSGKGESSKE
jgi:molybdopterin converting factor small subunit